MKDIFKKIKNPSKDVLTIIWIILGFAMTLADMLAGASWFISAWFMDRLINNAK